MQQINNRCEVGIKELSFWTVTRNFAEALSSRHVPRSTAYINILLCRSKGPATLFRFQY